MAGQVNHVRFHDTKPEENSILVEPTEENTVKVSLGFLKYFYRYRIEVYLLKSYVNSISSFTFDVGRSSSNCCITSLLEDANGYALTVELVAVETNYVEENLVFYNGVHSIVITLCASVLDRGKGTPLLKEGIHLLEKLAIYES